MAMKNYRDESAAGPNRKLIIVLIILAVIFVFTGLVWPGFWR